MMTTFQPISKTTQHMLLAKLCEDLEDAILILDADLRYVFVNRAHEILIGYSQEFLLGRPLGIYDNEFLPEHELQLLNSAIQNLNENEVYQSSIVMSTRYEQNISCQLMFSKSIIAGDAYYVGIIRDETDVIKQEAQLTQQKDQLNKLNNYNQITGLPNRKVFLAQASQLLNESHQQVVIIRLNIDRYRILISTLGLESTNNLIKQFSDELSALELEQLRCFAHFGGDDFGLLFEFADANFAHNALDLIMQLCECPFLVDDNLLCLHISVGVSYAPCNGNHLKDLMSKAEKALLYAKQQGGDDVYWYRPDLNITTDYSLGFEAELRLGLIKGQFIPYYQPKIELTTGRIIGFEALVRWQHPTKGLLSPTFFIDAIAKYKLSFELFHKMASQIAEQLQHWQKLELPQHICINADAAEFSQPNFFKVIKTLLDSHQISGHRLQIEITESSLMLRHAEVKSQLKAIKELGVCLALDDFGTGYASLSYLQEYPFDFIKIDQSFTSKIVVDSTQKAIVKAILDLAKALNMKAVAEGIETQDQRDILVDIGCNYGQGFWFSHPVTAEKATKMLLDQRAAHQHYEKLLNDSKF